MSKRFLIVLAVVWTAAIGLAGFSLLRPDGAADPGQQASSSGAGGQTQAEQQQTSQRNSSGRSSDRDGEDGRAVVKNSGSSANSGDPGTGKVTLKLDGEPGAAFTGRCVVDGETRQVSGETPETLTYEPDEKLECEITSRDGPLRVSFSDSQGTNTTQTVGPGASTLELTYTGDGLTSSTSSNSQTGSSQTGSSQSIVQQSSSSVTQSGAE